MWFQDPDAQQCITMFLKCYSKFSFANVQYFYYTTLVPYNVWKKWWSSQSIMLIVCCCPPYTVKANPFNSVGTRVLGRSIGIVLLMVYKDQKVRMGRRVAIYNSLVWFLHTMNYQQQCLLQDMAELCHKYPNMPILTYMPFNTDLFCDYLPQLPQDYVQGYRSSQTAN